jgi:hypothetical protein
MQTEVLPKLDTLNQMKSERTITPISFEILHNRHSLCTAGMSGRPGVLTAILHWVNRGHRDELELSVAGQDLSNCEDLTWANTALAVGDEVVIRIVESLKVTRPKLSEKPLTREFVEKQEKTYLRKTAKRYGYKLVKL